MDAQTDESANQDIYATVLKIRNVQLSMTERRYNALIRNYHFHVPMVGSV